MNWPVCRRSSGIGSRSKKQLTLRLQDPLLLKDLSESMWRKSRRTTSVQTITKEIAEVKISYQLNLFWLDEQRQIIEHLKEEILALNKGKDAKKNVQRGNLESRIHQLEYEDLAGKISAV